MGKKQSLRMYIMMDVTLCFLQIFFLMPQPDLTLTTLEKLHLALVIRAIARTLLVS